MQNWIFEEKTKLDRRSFRFDYSVLLGKTSFVYETKHACHRCVYCIFPNIPYIYIPYHILWCLVGLFMCNITCAIRTHTQHVLWPIEWNCETTARSKPIYIFRSASNVSLCVECVSVRRTLCLLIELLWTISVWSSWVSAAFWYSMLTCMKCNSNRIVTQSTELSIARRVTSMHIYHLWVTTSKPKHERCRLPGRVLDSTYNKSIYIRYDDMNNTAIKLVWNQILILFLCISSVF